MILKRNRPKTMSAVSVVEGSAGLPLQVIQQSNPLSQTFEIKGSTTKDLVRYLTACQVAKYGQVIPFSQSILLGMANQALKHYTYEQLYRGIKQASLLSLRPFSFKYVKKVIEDYKL